MSRFTLEQTQRERDRRRVKCFVHVVTRLDPKELRELSRFILRDFLELDRVGLGADALEQLNGNGLGGLADWLVRAAARARTAEGREEHRVVALG